MLPPHIYPWLGNLLLRLLLASVLLGQKSMAQALWWHSSPEAIHAQSDGRRLDSGFQAQLGIFADGFVPTGDNLDFWADHWLVLSGGLHDPETPWIEGEAHSINNSVFPEGSQAWVWVYNKKAIDETTEWALITNDDADGNEENETSENWSVPYSSLNVAEEWVMGNANQVLWGGLNGVNGGGDGVADPIGFTLQTRRLLPLADAIPEPHSLLLILSAGFGASQRRQRR